MNVESILDKIQLFEELVIDSGFRRDVEDFIQSIQQAQNQNLVFMKGISQRIQMSFMGFEKNSLDSELKTILRDNEPFTSENTVDELRELDAHQEIDAPAYFQKFNNILSNLVAGIRRNQSELSGVNEVLKKYVSNQFEFQEETDQALVSLIFRDLKSTGGLKEFSKVLNRWNTSLLVLYQLVKSDPPEEISLFQIQNGSIDVIFNIDVDVAVDLTDLIKTALTAYAAFLLYKSEKAREIIESYLGNKELIKMEAQREQLMLDNIKLSVENRATELHKERLVSDKKIDRTAIKVKVKSISAAITDHIIKGNELKLLTPPETDKDQSDKESVSTELREKTAIVRERFKKLSSEEQILLLEKYAVDETD